MLEPPLSVAPGSGESFRLAHMSVSIRLLPHILSGRISRWGSCKASGQEEGEKERTGTGIVSPLAMHVAGSMRARS